MTPPREVEPWHDYFLRLAEHVASRSKHPRSQHGAVLVGASNRVVATGYNGPPSGFPDDRVDWSSGMTWTSRDWTIHAEENALLYAGIEACRGCRLYVTGLPCPRCFLRIAHCEVEWVVCGDATYSQADADVELLRTLCQLTGVRLLRPCGSYLKPVFRE